MSHVRNLFLKPSAHGYAPPANPRHFAAIADGAARFAPPVGSPTGIASAPEFGVQSATIPEFSSEQACIRPEQRLVYYTDPHSPAADRFRYLRMRLREHQKAGKLKTLLITSALPDDGKSTVTLNLATALAERGQRRVLLLEADLHKSCLVEKLGLKTWGGLAESLHDGLDPLFGVRRVDPFGWHLLPAGEPPRNPTELLQTPGFAAALQRLAPHFDWILIDSPPVVLLTDAISLQQHVDGTVMVVRAGRTPREAVGQAITLLDVKKINAVVLNGVEARNHLYSRYQSYEGT
jgi:capsular exopolysaccharide synthesis family protein